MATPPRSAPSFTEIFMPSTSPHIASSPITTRFPMYHAQSGILSPLTNTVTKPTPSERLHSRVRSAEALLPSPTVKGSYSNAHRTPLLAQTTIDSTTPIAIGDQSAPCWDDLYADQVEGFGDGLDETVTFASPTKIIPPSTPISPSLARSPFSSPLGGAQPKRRRQLSGLGTPGAQRGAKRIRQATLDANSMPMSPTRRQREPSTSFTTTMPLPSRSASSSSVFLHPGTYSMDRNVSSASVMTTSTTLLSPTLSAVISPFQHDHLGMLPSSSLTSIPDLGGSNHPSPNFSTGQSPHAIDTPQGGTSFVFANSPELDANFYNQGDMQVQGEMTLMSNVMSAMPSANSLPNSTSAASVSSFPSQPFRQNTLSTINEASLGDPSAYYGDTVPAVQYPTQPHMEHVQHFQQMDYPAVPGMQLSYPLSNQAQPPDVQAWAQQTQQAYNLSITIPPQPQATYGYAQPMSGPHSASARHVSQSFLQQQQMHPTDMPGFIPIQRSVSVPHIPTTMSQQSFSIPQHMSSGGLFPVAPTHNHGMVNSVDAPPGINIDQASFDARPPTAPWNKLPSTSPDTPRKKYPAVGTRLKPGPKPKGKTPKKGVSASSPLPHEEVPSSASGSGNENNAEASGSGSGSGSINPSLLAGSTGGSGSGSGSGSGPQVIETASSPVPAMKLEFGPSLTALAVNIQRPNNSTYQSQPTSASSQPSSSLPSAQPVASGSVSQPTLIIDPPRQVTQPAESSANGLPRGFLEKLYETYVTLEGSHTGQPIKRFRCMIEGCERNFPRKSAIHSHIQTHLEDKPYTCEHPDW